MMHHFKRHCTAVWGLQGQDRGHCLGSSSQGGLARSVGCAAHTHLPDHHSAGPPPTCRTTPCLSLRYPNAYPALHPHCILHLHHNIVPLHCQSSLIAEHTPLRVACMTEPAPCHHVLLADACSCMHNRQHNMECHCLFNPTRAPSTGLHGLCHARACWSSL